MDSRVARRITVGHDRSEFKVYKPYARGYSKKNNVCAHWLAGRCNRNLCRFVHGDPRSLIYDQNHNQYRSSPEDNWNMNSKLSPKLSQTSMVIEQDSEVSHTVNDKERVIRKKPDSICENWISNNCVNGDKCQYLHSWSRGADFTRFTQLEGHRKAITGIAFTSGSDKLYSASSDGKIRVWDCISGQCCNVINLEDKVGSLISEGSWVFVGMPNVVKAWNIVTFAEHSLTGPVGEVYAMIVGKETLFAGAQDGSILAWRSSSETGPFDLAASIKGHNASVLSLTVGKDMLYSGSMDLTIKVWDIDTLKCLHTLNGHSKAVSSLLCWDQYLLSSSLDGNVKVWAATESGELKVTYTHKEDHGVLALCGIHDTEAKPILLCSCSDSSVRLYELPFFTDRGTLFVKQEVRAIQSGPGGLFFTGDGSGQLAVWKTL